MSHLEFLKKHNSRIINSVGPRYTKEVNIQTEYLNYFEPLLRTEKYRNKVLKYTGELERKFDDVIKRSNDKKIKINKTKLNKLKRLHTLVIPLLFQIARKSDFPIKRITNLLNDYEKTANELRWTIRSLKESEDANSLNHDYTQFENALSHVKRYVLSKESTLFNKNILWLNGQAGEGKTHLLCDIATHRMKEGKPTLILVGTDFNISTNIWKTLCIHLQLDTSKPKENFLNYIDTLSKSCDERVLLLIDAVNEGEGINIWKKQLSSFVNAISKNSSISVCLSCRTTYEFFFDLEKIKNKIVRLTHRGFKNSLTLAVKEYFSHYKIKYHEVPLVTEFSNPLFLQVYCKTLRKEKSQGPYRGHKGMKDIIEKYFYQVDRNKISKKLNYSNTIKPSWDLAKLIAERMASKAVDFLTLNETKELEKIIIDKKGLNKGLLREMLQEGLLIKDGHYEVNDEVIRFSYQKFSDHLITRYLLNKYLKKDKVKKTYSLDLTSNELQEIFDKPYIFGGLLDAMSAQVPERTKSVDLLELAPQRYRSDYYDSYLDSLIWRDPSTIKDTKTVIKYFNEMLNDHYESYNSNILTTLISLSTVPKHPLNAIFLTKILKNKKMPKRDFLWTKFINDEFQEENSITQLVVSWAWDDMDISSTNTESIQLLTNCISWFFTSSNRFLRDKSTKALTRILTESLLCSEKLIHDFIDVDDPYILERITTATYGAIIRSVNKKEIEKTSKTVYQKILIEKKPINIVTLHYAEKILKVAQVKGCNLKFIDWKKTKTPFGFKVPKRLPTIDTLKKKIGGYPKNDKFNKHWGLVAVESSVLDMGDFARYVIGTDQGYIDWKDTTKPSTQDIERKFYNNLRKKIKPFYEALAESAESYKDFKSGNSFSKARKEDIELWLQAYEVLHKEFSSV